MTASGALVSLQSSYFKIDYAAYMFEFMVKCVNRGWESHLRAADKAQSNGMVEMCNSGRTGSRYSESRARIEQTLRFGSRNPANCGENDGKNLHSLFSSSSKFTQIISNERVRKLASAGPPYLQPSNKLAVVKV